MNNGQNENTIRLVGHALSTADPEQSKILNSDARKRISEQQERNRNAFEREFPEFIKSDMYLFSLTAKDFLTQRAKRLGIDQNVLSFPKTLAKGRLTPPLQKAQILGRSYSDTGIVIDEESFKENFDDTDLQDFFEAETILEELWHASTRSTWLVEQDAQGPKVTLEAEKKNAMEEGLFRVFMYAEGLTFLKKYFPEGYTKFEKICDQKGFDPFETTLTLVSQHGNEIQWGTIYKDSTELVEYILWKVTKGNIGELEQARYNEIANLNLSRKINTIFGLGSYKQIMSVKDSQARELLAQLKLKSPNKTLDKQGI